MVVPPPNPTLALHTKSLAVGKVSAAAPGSVDATATRSKEMPIGNATTGAMYDAERIRMRLRCAAT